MKSALLALFAFITFNSSTFAKIEILTPFEVENGIPAWTKSFSAKVKALKASNSYPSEGYTECRETNEIRDAFLCQSTTQREMNSSLGRASFFVEGLGDPSNKGQIKLQDDPTYQMYKDMIGGHDLRGKDLLRFHKKAQEECASSNNYSNICYNPYEKDIFENFILRKAKERKDFVVITFANSSSMNWRDVVSHEIMHAQYFNQKVFREIVDTFWENEVTETDRGTVRRILGQYYDSSDELLMRNEFQAYILMVGAENSELNSFVEKFRKPLLERLKAKGVIPVQVK